MKKEIGKRVGYRIKVRRLELEIPQGELADTLGISQGMLSHLEKGRRTLSLEMLEKAAQALQCSMVYLLGEEKEAA